MIHSPTSRAIVEQGMLTAPGAGSGGERESASLSATISAMPPPYCTAEATLVHVHVFDAARGTSTTAPVTTTPARPLHAALAVATTREACSNM